MKKYLSNPASLNKLWVVVSTTLIGAMAAGLIVGAPALWVTLVIGAVTGAGVFSVGNAPLPPKAPAAPAVVVAPAPAADPAPGVPDASNPDGVA